MDMAFLKLDEAENVLREWFETGIAYNLILGTLKDRKNRGLVAFRQTLASIPLLDRPYFYNILEKAFNPCENALHVVMAHLNPEQRLSSALIANVYILKHNYPNLSFQVFTQTTVLEPKNIIRAYYLIRSELDKARQEKCSIEIIDRTLIALSKLLNEKQLTSSLVHVEERPSQNGNTPFVIHSYDLFTNKENKNLDGERIRLGYIHRHFIDIARKHELGKNPLEDVRYPLLDGKAYTQWAPMLHALCRHYESCGAAEYYKTYRAYIPINYEFELDSARILPHFDRLRKREIELRRFLKPQPEDLAQTPEDPFGKINPTLVRKMVLCHMIMFYLSMMNQRSWFIEIRQYVDELRKLYPKDYLDKLISYKNEQEVMDEPLLSNIKELFNSNPVGLFPWMFGGLLPEPMDLMKHYFWDKVDTGVEQIVLRNKCFKQLNLAQSALLIPKYLRGVDTSLWLKPLVMVQLPSDRLQACVFYAPETLSKEKRLYLAGLLCTDQYTEEILKDNLTMETKTLEDLLLGICYLWHDNIIRKISVRKFLDTLQDCGFGEMSELTLKKRIDKAKYWLGKWPDVTLFQEI